MDITEKSISTERPQGLEASKIWLAGPRQAHPTRLISVAFLRHQPGAWIRMKDDRALSCREDHSEIYDQKDGRLPIEDAG
jgi:hypothetical protein